MTALLKNVEERIKIHRQGLSQMREGLYTESIETLRKGIESYGPHVGPIADIAGNHLLAGQIGEFKNTVLWLEEEFKKSLDLLSAASKIKTHITLAKYYEELCQIQEAFQQIELAEALCAPGDLQYIFLSAQKLRLKSYFNVESKLHQDYQLCIHLSQKSENVRMECLHALILAESRLMGLEFAWKRFETEALKTNGIQNDYDLRLCLFDLLEQALQLKNLDVQTAIVGFIQTHDIQTEDRFERCLLKLSNNSEFSPDFSEIFYWSEDLSPLCLLRILALAYDRTKNTQTSNQIRKQFTLHCFHLHHQSKALIFKKWSAFESSGEEQICLRLNAKELKLSFLETHLDLQKSPRVLEILLHFSKSSSIDIQSLLEDQSDFYQATENLRINIVKLNKKLEKLTGERKCIQFSKNQLTLRSSISIKIET